MITQLFSLTFIYLFYFLLVRENKIDIKIEYVPNNIIFQAYITSITFVICYSLMLKSFTPVKNGLISFLVVFCFALVEVCVGYIQALLRRKRRLKKGNNIELDTSEKVEIVIEKKESAFSIFLSKYQKQIFFAYGLLISLVIALFQKYLHFILAFLILAIPFTLSLLIYDKTKIKHKKSDNAFEVMGIAFALLLIFTRLLARPEITKDLLILEITALILAIIVEFILGSYMHCLFYEEGDILTDEYGFALSEEEQPKPENPTINDDVEFSIGGGDLFIFGAMGIMTGTLGLIEIFINTAFVQFFCLMPGFYILNKGKKALPLVPAISIGYIMYFLDCNIINITSLLQSFIN